MQEENSLISDNPLHLTSLFGQGIFLIKETSSLQDAESVIPALQSQRVVHLFTHQDNADIPHNFRETFEKIVAAIKWNGQAISKDQMVCKNTFDWPNPETTSNMINALEPAMLILWHERDVPGFPPLTPFNTGEYRGIPLLKLSSPDMILSSQPMKNTTWYKLKQFFGMS